MGSYHHLHYFLRRRHLHRGCHNLHHQYLTSYRHHHHHPHHHQQHGHHHHAITISVIKDSITINRTRFSSLQLLPFASTVSKTSVQSLSSSKTPPNKRFAIYISLSPTLFRTANSLRQHIGSTEHFQNYTKHLRLKKYDSK